MANPQQHQHQQQVEDEEEEEWRKGIPWDTILRLPSSSKSTTLHPRNDRPSDSDDNDNHHNPQAANSWFEPAYLISKDRGYRIALSCETKLSTATTTTTTNNPGRNDDSSMLLWVGRQASIADIRIQHGSVSRRHAMLFYSKIQDHITLMIKDLGSKHGITINSLKMKPYDMIRLHHHDSIYFGNVRDTIFTIEWNETKINQPPSTILNPEIGKTTATTHDTNNQNIPHNLSTETTTITSSTSLLSDDNTAITILRKDQERINQASKGLTGRAKNQSEINAMIDSLSDNVVWVSPINDTTTKDTVTTSTTNVISKSHDDDETNYFIQKYQLPISHRYMIKSEEGDNKNHSNKVMCLEIHSSGTKFIVGRNDQMIRLYDFNTMKLSEHDDVSSGNMIVEDGYWPIACSFCSSSTNKPQSSSRHNNDYDDDYNDVAITNKTTSLIVATGSVAPTVVTYHEQAREMIKEIQFMNGDQYVIDPMKTVGHTQRISDLVCHPYDHHIIITSSYDGSVRIWNLQTGKKIFQGQKVTCSQTIIIKNYHNGQKTLPTSLAFHPNGSEFIVGTICGSIQIFTYHGSSHTYHRPNRIYYSSSSTRINKLLSPESIPDTVHYIQYNRNGTYIGARYNYCHDNNHDDHDNDHIIIRLWNAKTSHRDNEPILLLSDRIASTATEAQQHDYHYYDHMNFDFNVNGQLLIAPSASSASYNTAPDSYRGVIHIYDISDSTTNNNNSKIRCPIMSIPMISSSSIPIIIKWHPLLQQIFVGCSNGTIIILYDEQYGSKKGILIPLSKQSKKKSHDSSDPLMEIYQSRILSQGGLEAVLMKSGTIQTLYDEENQKKKKKKRLHEIQEEKVLHDQKYAIPERPAKKYQNQIIQQQQQQMGGAPTTFQQYVSDQTNSSSPHIIAGNDPREALFRYHNNEESSHHQNQNNKLLTRKTMEQEEDEMQQRQRSNRR